MATRDELIQELEQINIDIAELYHDRVQAIKDYRSSKADWKIEEAETLRQLNAGEIQTAYKASEADKEKYTIQRCDSLWNDYNEAKVRREAYDAKYQMLDTRRSVIQTLLRGKE